MAQPIPYAEGNFPAVYVSGGPRARAIVALSWVMIVLGWAMLWPIIHRILAWRGAMTGDYFVTEDDLVTAEYTLPDLVGIGLNIVYLLVALAAFVVWLIWVHRTYANLKPLGARGLTYSPGWAVGYYFIPILNLFRPLQVIRETWRASDPDHAGGMDWQRRTAPALLGWWWALRLGTYIVRKVLDALGTTAADDASMQYGLAVADAAMVAADTVMLLIVIRIARTLTTYQDARAERVGAHYVPGAPSARAMATDEL